MLPLLLLLFPFPLLLPLLMLLIKHIAVEISLMNLIATHIIKEGKSNMVLKLLWLQINKNRK